jgi:hypothetical protein
MFSLLIVHIYTNYFLQDKWAQKPLTDVFMLSFHDMCNSRLTPLPHLKCETEGSNTQPLSQSSSSGGLFRTSLAWNARWRVLWSSMAIQLTHTEHEKTMHCCLFVLGTFPISWCMLYMRTHPVSVFLCLAPLVHHWCTSNGVLSCSAHLTIYYYILIIIDIIDIIQTHEISYRIPIPMVMGQVSYGYGHGWAKIHLQVPHDHHY